jgi:hypothetical protein
VLQGRYQGLSLFDAAFDLTWLTCLSSENEHLPGTLRSPVQITLVSIMSSNGVPLQEISDTVGHKSTHVTETVYRHVIVPAIRGGATVMDQVFGQTDDGDDQQGANAAP